MSNYGFSFRDARGITFESGNDVNSTIRFTRAVAPKTVDGVKLTNVRSDTVAVRQTDPRGPDCQDCSSVMEPLSVRLILSGSRNNSAELEKMLASVLFAVWSNRTTLLQGSLPALDATVVENPTITITAA